MNNGRKSNILRAISLLLLVFSCVGGIYYNYRYPFGWSHCCDKELDLALHRYAEDHGGFFPFGENTPEASLSLLYPKYADANLLRGKSVSLKVVEPLLDQGKRLGPDSCGWHYVEGLKLDDNPELALFWDKVGLGHNGSRLPEGDHLVIFLSGHSEYVSGKSWKAFLMQQQNLLAVRK